jgi:hypothetical protein
MLPADIVARKLLSFLPFTLQAAIFSYHGRLIGSVVSTMLPRSCPLPIRGTLFFLTELEYKLIQTHALRTPYTHATTYVHTTRKLEPINCIKHKR